jgi:PAS domain S-box-containing protein
MDTTVGLAYEGVFEHGLDAVLLTRPDGQILDANQAACRLFGYTVTELRAQGRLAVVDISDSRVKAAINERRATGRFSGIIPMRRRDGTSFLAHLSSAIFNTVDGEERTSMFVRDLSATERREQMLIAANENLARALAEVHRLSGIVPICSYCKNVRDGQHFWVRVEEFISARSPLEFTHGICPTCYARQWGGSGE